MKILSIKLDDSLFMKLSALAKKRGTTQSALVRDALEANLIGTNGRKKSSSLSPAKNLAGCVQGPKDLSTNKAHLKKFGL